MVEFLPCTQSRVANLSVPHERIVFLHTPAVLFLKMFSVHDAVMYTPIATRDSPGRCLLQRGGIAQLIGDVLSAEEGALFHKGRKKRRRYHSAGVTNPGGNHFLKLPFRGTIACFWSHVILKQVLVHGSEGMGPHRKRTVISSPALQGYIIVAKAPKNTCGKSDKPNNGRHKNA
jgi:hypothetical protein